MLDAIRIIAIALGAVATLATLVAAIEGHREKRKLAEHVRSIPVEPVSDAEFKAMLDGVDESVLAKEHR